MSGGRFHYKQKEEIWGGRGADAGWRKGQHDYKESEGERAIWRLRRRRGESHLLFGSMCCDERRQDP